MVAIEQILDSDLEEKDDLLELAEEARQFLLAHRKWCKGIKAGFFDRGFSKAAVFYFEIEPAAGGDPRVWMVVGDIPPAYIDYKTCPNGAAALDGYVAEMLAWADAVKNGRPTERLIPVLRRGSLTPVEKTPSFAEMLESRMNFIKRELLSQWPEEVAVGPLRD